MVLSICQVFFYLSETCRHLKILQINNLCVHGDRERLGKRELGHLGSSDFCWRATQIMFWSVEGISIGLGGGRFWWGMGGGGFARRKVETKYTESLRSGRGL